MAVSRWFGLLAAACVPLLLAGCMAQPKEQAKEVAKYRKVLDGPTSRPVEDLEPGEPVTLGRALELANRNHEQLGISGENYLQALYDKDRAFSAFLPTVTLVPTYTRQQRGASLGGVSGTGTGTGTAGGGTGVTPTPAGRQLPGETGSSDGVDTSGTGGTSLTSVTGGSRRESTDVPVRGAMNLFNGFRDVANYRRAEAVIALRRATLLDAQAVVLLDVAQTFYQVLRSERSVEVLENSLRVQGERVRDIQAKHRAGLARPLDVAQTEAQESQTRVNLIQAQSDVRNGRKLLAFLTGTPIEAHPLVDDFGLPASVPSGDELVQEAESQRQDLAAARFNVEAARQGVQDAFGEYYPSVSLTLNYWLERQSSSLGSWWSGAVAANIPIFEAGRIEADAKTALSALRQATLNESLVRRTIDRDVLVAQENLTAADERVRELRVQLEAAQEAFRQAEQSYNVGLATNLERLTAQDSLLSTQLQLVSAEFDRKVFYLDLRRTIGRLSTQIPGEGEVAPATQPSPAEVKPVGPVGPRARPTSGPAAGPLVPGGRVPPGAGPGTAPLTPR